MGGQVETRMENSSKAASASNGIILYASYQKGTALPGYVRYALDGLARTGFAVVLITTQSPLDCDSLAFLSERRIALFSTENGGFDFGMWRRYLESIPESERHAFERVVLINDSVVYFRDVFCDLFQRAEAQQADLVSLSSNEDFGFHLQSFFLYLKPRAIFAFFEHLFASGTPGNYWDAVMDMEVGLSRKMIRQNLVLEPLYRLDGPFDLSYESVIRMHAGFVKRKLLEKRYTFGQTLYFLRKNRRAFDLDYLSLILDHGAMDSRFKPEWLTTRPSASIREKARQRFWRLLFWGWTWISNGCVLAVALVLGLQLEACYGVFVGLASTVVCAFMMFWLRRLGRRWMEQRSVRPLDRHS